MKTKSDRERWTFARDAAFTFQRFDECGFFATDIGACTEVNIDIKIKAFFSSYIIT